MAVLQNDHRHVEEIQNIINTPPHWLIRWGMLLCFLILLSVVAGSTLIQYPEVVKSNIVIVNADLDKGDLQGEMNFSQERIHRIRKGQKILIKLKDKHFEEYGILTGKIRFVSDATLKGGEYFVKIGVEIKDLSELDNSLELKNVISGDADIVVTDYTLFTRIISNPQGSKVVIK